MLIKIDNRTPIYLQIIDYFKKEIASEALALGDTMPSRRDLAASLKINLNTVQRAYREMENLGMIYTDGNLPSKVTKDKQVVARLRQSLLTESLTELIALAKLLNIPLTEILPLVEKYYQKEGESHDRN